MDEFEQRLAASLKDAAARRPDLARRSSGRRTTIAAAAGAVLVAAAVATVYVVGQGGEPRGAGPAGPATPTPGIPDVVDLTCTPGGIELSATVVRTQAAGLVINVTETPADGAYLSYSTTGPAGPNGGTGLPEEPGQMTLEVSPGTVTLGCAGRTGPEASFELIDPDGNWSGETDLEAIDCAGESQGLLPSDAVNQSADEEEAVRATADWVARTAPPPAAPLTIEPVAVGYAGSPTRVWLTRSAGKPFSTISAELHEGDYIASPRNRCGVKTFTGDGSVGHS